jgi:putative nucleotidyltransferase with HDIG domain
VGTGRIARLILLHVLRRALPPETEPVRRVWRHTLLAACAAREIARASGRATHSHEAFVAGLLHDLGCLLLADEPNGEPGGHEDEGWDLPQQQLEAERRQHGLDHAQLGAHVCGAWSLPEELTRVVRLHHTVPPLPVELDGRELDLLRIVQQGDRLASLLGARPRFGELPPDERLALLERTCIHPAWDWTPAGPTHLDLLVQHVLDRHAEHVTALAIDAAPLPSPGSQGDQST